MKGIFSIATRFSLNNSAFDYVQELGGSGSASDQVSAVVLEHKQKTKHLQQLQMENEALKKELQMYSALYKSVQSVKDLITKIESRDAK